jgi:hypothetical protein
MLLDGRETEIAGSLSLSFLQSRLSFVSRYFEPRAASIAFSNASSLKGLSK